MARPKSPVPMLNFTVRIPVALRDQLLAICACRDVQATQVVRSAIRQYIADAKAEAGQ
jgi:hypothetical protein